MRVSQEISIRKIFDKLRNKLAYFDYHRKSAQAYWEVNGEKITKKEGQILDKLLIFWVARAISTLQVQG
jgi:hypothetical protein